MTTSELIKKLQEADPEGNQEVVVKCEDGYCYDVWGAKLGNSVDGIEADEDDEVEPNCLIIDATN